MRYQFMKLPNENEIEFHEVKPDGFHKGIGSGEIQPHDVEIIVKYRDGSTETILVSWETIVELSQKHGVSAVKDMYEFVVYN